MKSRDIVYNTLNFLNTDGLVPRHIWVLPWAANNHEEALNRIHSDFPDDIGNISAVYSEPPREIGNPYEVGKYVDPWGCKFTNITRGIIGEMKEPLIAPDDEAWNGAAQIHIPREFLSFDPKQVNDACETSDLFNLAGFCARPFEQLQFIRGTEDLYVDLMDPPPKMLDFIGEMHKLYCEIYTKWSKTDIDGIMFMDDWGSQNSLLISPALWREIFKPMYKDYIDIAHSHGKKTFMHSDGYILQIIPDLIEIGLDALNCQIFCMGLDKLREFKGRITFWGELDRQWLLPYGTAAEVEQAVKDVYNTLWADGGCIAQLEFGAGANPENVYHAFKTWAGLRI